MHTHSRNAQYVSEREIDRHRHRENLKQVEQQCKIMLKFIYVHYLFLHFDLGTYIYTCIHLIQFSKAQMNETKDYGCMFANK